MHSRRDRLAPWREKTEKLLVLQAGKALAFVLRFYHGSRRVDYHTIPPPPGRGLF